MNDEQRAAQEKTRAKQRQRDALAARLRDNLQRRKAQSRARRAGAADERPEGLLPDNDADQET